MRAQSVNIGQPLRRRVGFQPIRDVGCDGQRCERRDRWRAANLCVG